MARAKMAPKSDLLGQRFGRLVVTAPADRKRGRTAWKCACDCGSHVVWTSNDLVHKGGSCGCSRNNTELDFWKYVEKTEDCWPWVGGRFQNDYGKFCFRKRTLLAHRFSWGLAFGSIPRGMLVCHKCDNPPCVRPDHLFLGTSVDNALDAQSKGRLRGGRPAGFKGVSRPGESNPNAKLSSADVTSIRRQHVAGIHRRMLAAMYGLSVHGIENIIYRKTWRSEDHANA